MYGGLGGVGGGVGGLALGGAAGVAVVEVVHEVGVGAEEEAGALAEGGVADLDHLQQLVAQQADAAGLADGGEAAGDAVIESVCGRCGIKSSRVEVTANGSG